MAVDWLMRTVTHRRRLDIRLALMTVLENLDYADDIDLLSIKHQDAQQKLNVLAKQPTLMVSELAQRTQVLRKNTRVNDPDMIDGNT